MQKNSSNFSMQDALRMVNSPAGQQLLSLLRQTDNSAVQQAIEQASNGDYTHARESLAPLLASDEVKKLLQQLGG